MGTSFCWTNWRRGLGWNSFNLDASECRRLLASSLPDTNSSSEPNIWQAQPPFHLWSGSSSSCPKAQRAVVKTDFQQKTGRSRAVYESIRKIPWGNTTEILVPSQPLIRFFPSMAKHWLCRALGAKNGPTTFGTSPRRSDAPADPSASRLPFGNGYLYWHFCVSTIKRKRLEVLTSGEHLF